MMEEIGPVSCPVAGFHTNGIEISGSVTREFANELSVLIFIELITAYV
jgi:hypothetical protein